MCYRAASPFSLRPSCSLRWLQVVAAVVSNGGRANDYLPEVGGRLTPSLPSLPLLLLPTCPSSVELLQSAHVVVGNEMTTKFVPSPSSRQVCVR